MRKTVMLALLASLFVSCSAPAKKDGKEILDQSIAFHDPQGHWSRSELKLYIQEPRVPNPPRFSELSLNNADGSFKLLRNREDRMASYIIEAGGESYTLLDGERVSDTALIKKYRLDPKINPGYRNFYQTMMGLPMSLESKMDSILDVYDGFRNGKPCYILRIELKEPLFTKKWKVFINKDNFRFEGLETQSVRDQAEGGEGSEVLLFNGSIEVNGMKLPRMRHWYMNDGETYLGSDIILKELE